VIRRAVLLVVLLLAALPATAHATVSRGEYGGGGVVTPIPQAGARVNWLSAYVIDPATALIGGKVTTPCGFAVAPRRTTALTDGAFVETTRFRDRSGAVRRTHRVTFSGRFDGTTAVGTITATLRLKRRDGSRRRCSYGPLPWQLRLVEAPAATPAPAAPQPGATYYGLTSQRLKGERRPFLLVVAPDATRIDTAVMGYIKQCRIGPWPSDNMSPPFSVRPDGTFRLRERFTERFADARERYLVRIDGRFTAGGARGTLRVTSVARQRGSRRLVDRCDTGPVTFAAST
jgi:hypothetical protein